MNRTRGSLSEETQGVTLRRNFHFATVASGLLGWRSSWDSLDAHANVNRKIHFSKTGLMRDCQYSWCIYLLLPHLITGVVTISRALRKQRRAQRMSSSFLSGPQFWSGAEPPPPQFCAKVVAASTCLAKRRRPVRKMFCTSFGSAVRIDSWISSLKAR